MAKLINTAEVKKAPSEDIIKSMKKMSDILLDRYLNDPNYDIEQVFQALLGDKCFNSPDDIRLPFIVNESIIAIPSLLPKKKSDGSRKNGKNVVPMVQIPGEEPYYAWTENTSTFIDQRIIKLRGGRSITLHKIIPGMIVSFHHYVNEDGYRDRERIDAVKIFYDNDNNAVYESVDEEEALFRMPDPSISRQNGIM